MRALAYYIFGALVLTVYGEQVCPFMESLSPQLLGGVLGAWLAVAFVVRLALLGPVVRAAPLEIQPRRQFTLDMGLFMAAGLGAGVYNLVVFGFPVASGALLVLGCAAVGFFAGVDTALARERGQIREARAQGLAGPPPRRLTPVTRRFALVATIGLAFAAAVVTLVLLHDLRWLEVALASGASDELRNEASRTVLEEVLIVLGGLGGLGLVLIGSYAANLRLLFDTQTTVLERVSHGDLSLAVPVTTRDEFGVIAGHTNLMIEGLRHRRQLMGELEVAEEVQQTLLPATVPTPPGVRLAGVCRYSTATGGDFYDFIPLTDGGVAVAVGDVTGHGVGAALLMASARAYLRAELLGQAADRLPETLPGMIGRVNRRLCEDVRDTGRFVTLLVAVLAADGGLATVRAGHDPAWLVSPDGANVGLRQLAAGGMLLGVEPEAVYHCDRLEGPERPGPGSLLVIGTDGIFEQPDASGAMYGKERFEAALGRAAGATRELPPDGAAGRAETIVHLLLADLDLFRGDVIQEDDVTCVVASFDGC